MPVIRVDQDVFDFTMELRHKLEKATGRSVSYSAAVKFWLEFHQEDCPEHGPYTGTYCQAYSWLRPMSHSWL